jgi:hypothetical protein
MLGKKKKNRCSLNQENTKDGRKSEQELDRKKMSGWDGKRECRASCEEGVK